MMNSSLVDRVDDLNISELAEADIIDLDSPAHIRLFIDSFYEKVLTDALLAPIFTDVAKIDIAVHIPTICSYWEKLLLGDKTYQRHTMNIHRAVDQQFPFSDAAFERWLALFTQTATAEFFAGPMTDRALVVATTIAKNMQVALQKS